jgi:hypothetical protein
VCMDDVISIDWDGKENGLRFLKENAGALLSASSQVPESMAQAAVASSGSREVTLPAPKTKAAESVVADGTVGTTPHRQDKQRVNSDQPKPRMQVERVRVIARPH